MNPTQSIEEWLRDPNLHMEVFEHQDGAWCIASSYTTSQLVALYCLEGSIPNRRDEILYAIAIKLQMLLGPDRSESDLLEKERQEILDFASRNWNEILRIDRDMGLSGDFDSHVVTYMNQRLNEGETAAGQTESTPKRIGTEYVYPTKVTSNLKRTTALLFLAAWSFGFLYSFLYEPALGIVVAFVVGVPSWVIWAIAHSRSNRLEQEQRNVILANNRKVHAVVFDMDAPNPVELETAEYVDLYDANSFTYLCRVLPKDIGPLIAAASHFPQVVSNDIPIVYESLEPPFMDKSNRLQAILQPHFDRSRYILLRWIPIAPREIRTCSEPSST